MANVTLAQARANLQKWVDAEAAVSHGQSYSIGDWSVSKVDLPEIRNEITYWNRVVNELDASSRNMRNPQVSHAKFT